jgi:hypothetical protein
MTHDLTSMPNVNAERSIGMKWRAPRACARNRDANFHLRRLGFRADDPMRRPGRRANNRATAWTDLYKMRGLACDNTHDRHPDHRQH